MLLAKDIFEDGKRLGKPETKDYRGMFDSSYFETWFAQLLNGLDGHNVKNAIIILDNALDNAKYQKAMPVDVPKFIDLPENATETMLWALLKDYMLLHFPPQIVSMAQKASHTVRCTPPYYSDLQPI
ncbi:hypothetical protein THRCLA_20549 [Thraustotheca clavata]|uniref:Uncharacterized protein n=1 Tax=Thraustotheca clavata TaxID=74557 RepID=A0A1W0A690_9STRA|nr:hypothetical protein THRCLA_20549 [Thraustotheca clavata]